jgi:hypothetical protein
MLVRCTFDGSSVLIHMSLKINFQERAQAHQRLRRPNEFMTSLRVASSSEVTLMPLLLSLLPMMPPEAVFEMLCRVLLPARHR